MCAAFCFLMAARGEPLLRDDMLEPNGKGLAFDDAKSDPLEHGRRSWGGEGAKHSSRLGEDVLPMLPKLSLSQPAPNLNGGHSCCSCCLKDTVLVEKFFVRERDGRRRMDFLRLRRVSKATMSSINQAAHVLGSRARSRNIEHVGRELWQLAGREHVVSVAGHHLRGWRRQCDVVEGSLVR